MTAIRSEVSRHRDIQDDGEADDLRKQSLLRFPRTDSDTRDFYDVSGNGEVPEKKLDGYSPRGAASLSGSQTSESLSRDQRAQGNNLTIDEEPHEEIWEESPSPETTTNQEGLKDEDKFYDQIAQSLSTLHEEEIADDEEEDIEEEQDKSDDDEEEEEEDQQYSSDDDHDEGEDERNRSDEEGEEEQDGGAKLSTKDKADSTSGNEQCNVDDHEGTVQVRNNSDEKISESKRSDSPQSATDYPTKDGSQVEYAREESVTSRDQTNDDTTNTGDKAPERRTSHMADETDVDQELDHPPSFSDRDETHSVHSRRVGANSNTEGSQVLPPKDNSDTAAGRGVEDIHTVRETNKHEDSTSMESTTSMVKKTSDTQHDEEMVSKNSRASLSRQAVQQNQPESKQLSNSRVTISSRKQSVKQTDLSSNGSKSSLSKELKGRKRSVSRKASQEDTGSTIKESHDNADRSFTRKDGDGFANTSLADRTLSGKDLHNGQESPSSKISHTLSGDGNTVDQYVDSKLVDEQVANSFGSFANDTKSKKEKYNDVNEGSALKMQYADIDHGSNQRSQENYITEDDNYKSLGPEATEDMDKKYEKGESSLTPSRSFDVKPGSYYILLLTLCVSLSLLCDLLTNCSFSSKIPMNYCLEALAMSICIRYLCKSFILLV